MKLPNESNYHDFYQRLALMQQVAEKAGDVVGARMQQYMEQHPGTTADAALDAVLKADEQLKDDYLCVFTHR